MAAQTSPPVLWRPSAPAIADASITRYTDWLTRRLGRTFADYEELWHWSVDELDTFWASIWEYFDVRAAQPYSAVLAGSAMPGARWFTNARLNFAEHVFRDRRADQVAILSRSELSADLEETTWGALEDLVKRIRTGLVALGVEPGDRVVAYLPNVPECVAAFLACASLGAIWASCSPDFGPSSAIDRFRQIEPKILLAVDGYRYGGRDFDRRDAIVAIRDALPTVESTVLLPALDRGATMPEAVPWTTLVAAPGEALTFEQLDFDHPLWVLYSSGTTGLPKAIVHGHGGTLVEQLKHQHLALDVRPDDRVLWFTTTGWMMWNSLVSSLLTGAAIVLYDGDPTYPDLTTLWDLAAESRATCFGSGAAFLAANAKQGIRPLNGRDLGVLRAIGSTGSPLSAADFAWVYEQFLDIWLFSTSGGTDLCSALVGGVSTLPVRAGELQARALGADVHAFAASGSPVIGEVGELVVTQPMPSMPLYFWDDPEGARLRASYFDRFPGIWRHGDWIEITAYGSAVIHGRSDATINRGGVRMGTSEIYSAVLSLPEVIDALVVDVDGWMPMFVVLRDDLVLDDQLRSRINSVIRQQCSPRHVPSTIVEIAEVPRTRSGKILEVPVKRILQGADPAAVTDLGAVANPQTLELFAGLRRSKRDLP
jgi:acetoacetyl-CoA synthetase